MYTLDIPEDDEEDFDDLTCEDTESSGDWEEFWEEHPDEFN